MARPWVFDMSLFTCSWVFAFLKQIVYHPRLLVLDMSKYYIIKLIIIFYIHQLFFFLVLTHDITKSIISIIKGTPHITKINAISTKN